MEGTNLTPEALSLIMSALLAVPLAWAVPRPYAFDAVAVWSLAVLTTLSPVSALWLVASSAGTVWTMRLGEQLGRQGALAAAWSAIVVGALLLSRQISGWPAIGVAYFTLRNIHVLYDGWMGRITPPGLRRMLQYQLFLPVLMIGPIHRIQNFSRECDRRRFDPATLAQAAERTLLGLAQAVILGEFLMGGVHRVVLRHMDGVGAFWRDWLLSALGWIQLYLTFAGFSSVAIGIALMMGLKIEENFDRPYRAQNLIDFWTRWHMTLSFWCRDYVFQPVTIATRNPVLGLLAAMLAMAVWHETSLYYVLWAVWQVLGIVGSRLFINSAPRRTAILLQCFGPLPELASLSRVQSALGPVAVLGWLSLAQPVLTRTLVSLS